MKCKATISLNNHPERIVTEVVDREGEQCSTVLKVTNNLGKMLSDEHTGPDCDRVEEITND